MPDATVMVADVTTKEGTGQKGPWKLYNLVDGNGDRFTTFSADLGHAIEALKGKRVDITYEVTERGNNLKTAVEAAAPEPDPVPGTGNYIKGRENPDTQRSIFASVALQQAVAFVNDPVRSGNVSLEDVDRVAGAFFYTLLRLSGQMTDEDIPF